MSSPSSKNNSARPRKSFLSMLLSLISFLPKFADHFTLQAHNRNMILERTIPFGCRLRFTPNRLFPESSK
jgi:hypothetical protein